MNTDTASIKYFNGMCAVIIIDTLPDKSVLCRALYPVRDRMPREDFITESDGLTDAPRIAHVHGL